MKKTLMLTTALFSSLFPFAALAFSQPPEWGHYPMMGWGWMWGSMGIGMMLFMLIFWVLLIAGVVALIRWLWSGPGGSVSAPASGAAAEDILKNRYAKGEIDKQEFELKLQDIRN